MRLTISPAAGDSTAIETGQPEVGYVPAEARILVDFDAPDGVGALELDHPEAVALVNSLMRAIHQAKEAKRAKAEAPAPPPATLPIRPRRPSATGPLSAKLARAR